MSRLLPAPDKYTQTTQSALLLEAVALLREIRDLLARPATRPPLPHTRGTNPVFVTPQVKRASLRGVCQRCAAMFDTYLSRSEAEDFIRLIDDGEAYDAAVRCAQRRVVQ